jgi:hypothetical protein
MTVPVPLKPALTMPCPVIVPPLSVAPLASVKVEPGPVRSSVPVPIAIAEPTVSVLSTNSVPPENATVCAALAASSSSLPVPATLSTKALPLSMIPNTTSSARFVPVGAVMCAAPVAVTAALKTP